MHTNTRSVALVGAPLPAAPRRKASPSTTTAADRRRRHLSVYHRALRAADTPEERAAVAARYRRLFSSGVHANAIAATETNVSAMASADLDRECREVTVTVAA